MRKKCDDVTIWKKHVILQKCAWNTSQSQKNHKKCEKCIRQTAWHTKQKFTYVKFCLGCYAVCLIDFSHFQWLFLGCDVVHAHFCEIACFLQIVTSSQFFSHFFHMAFCGVHIKLAIVIQAKMWWLRNTPNKIFHVAAKNEVKMQRKTLKLCKRKLKGR